MRGDLSKMINTNSLVWKKVIEDNKITIDK